MVGCMVDEAQSETQPSSARILSAFRSLVQAAAVQQLQSHLAPSRSDSSYLSSRGSTPATHALSGGEHAC